MKLADAAEILKLALVAAAAYYAWKFLKKLPGVTSDLANQGMTTAGKLAGQEWAGQIDRPWDFFLQELMHPTNAGPPPEGFRRLPGGGLERIPPEPEYPSLWELFKADPTLGH